MSLKLDKLPDREAVNIIWVEFEFSIVAIGVIEPSAQTQTACSELPTVLDLRLIHSVGSLRCDLLEEHVRVKYGGHRNRWLGGAPSQLGSG